MTVLLLGLQQVLSVFAFNLPTQFSSNKKPNTLRVLQWNVTNWDEGSRNEKGGSSFRQLMLELVKKENADLLCFQEFFEPQDTLYHQSNISAVVAMGFPYYHIVPTKEKGADGQSGIAIFSKYPIIDSAVFEFRNNYTGEHLVYADILVLNKKIRVYATHLQPLYLDESEYEISNWSKQQQKNGESNLTSILSKLKTAYQFRYKQASFVRKKLNESPYPVILCGDFNELPNSGVYFKVKGNLQDAFLQKGSGFGRTIPFISPTLRIDYILADRYFKVTQFQLLKVNYSTNHYPIEADLEF